MEKEVEVLGGSGGWTSALCMQVECRLVPAGWAAAPCELPS